MRLEDYLVQKREVIDQAITGLLDLTGVPTPLAEAMRYSLFPGGKRIRPILTLTAAETVGSSIQLALPFACAIEMIHAYSLIHDDLPSMDDDELRRGRPTCHVAYGEAVALLAGDALLTEAFRVMALAARESNGAEASSLRILEEVAVAAGAGGMVGGQVEDLKAEGKAADIVLVESIHERKTAGLIRAAVVAGAIAGGAAGLELAALRSYGESLGLAFQVIDDILDQEGKVEQTGKQPGRDVELGKATYPGVAGVTAAKQRATELLDLCLRALSPFADRAERLREIARYVVSRAVSA